MNILKVSNIYYPFLEMGGPPVKVRAIAERLVQRRHAVTVLTVNFGHPRRGGVREIGGVEVVYLPPVVRYRTLTITPKVMPFCLQRLRGFDVIHIYGLYDLLGPVVGFFCRRWNIPYVLEPLGMYRPIVRSFVKKRLYHALLGRYLRSHAARVIATSEQERQQLLEDGLPSSQIVLRRNGVDLTQLDVLPPRGRFRQKWGIQPEERVTLFLGRLVSVKSLDLLLEALAMLPLTTTRAVLAGPDEGDGYKEFLEETTTRLHLDGRVLFTGPLYGRDKLEALVDADVFVLPSLSESFGNAAAEAMACGLPVIVTEGCGIAPYVEDRAGLVVPHDAEALRDALQRLLTDSSLCQRFGAQGPVVAQGLSWDEPVAQMETIYGDLIAERDRSA
jgi:glycosyltransferase involved in cell wall biosynthesis